MKGSARPLQFSLTTILLVMGLVACCLAVMRLTILGGTAAVIVTSLALLRNALVAHVLGPVYVATLTQKLELFLESFSVALLSVVIAGVGFLSSLSLASCVGVLLFVPGHNDPDIVAVVAVAVAAAFCLTATIGPCVYAFWKLTFPLR